MLALCGLDILAVGLGIAGLLQKDRKKVLSILGIIFGAATLLVTIALVVLGNSM